MHEGQRKTISGRELMAAPVFYLLRVLLFPLTAIGYLILTGKAMLTGRGSGVSVTAQRPLSVRWFMHRLGTRPDEASTQLLMALPGVSPLGVRLVTGPLLLAHRLTGFVPSAFRYPFEGDIPKQHEASARVTFFDAAVERHLADVDQFVMLGAGFDTRAFRLYREARVQSFEVDAPKTQAIKREMVKKAGIDLAGVRFVSADFAKEDWLSRLVDTGFDPGKPALFLWEGVVPYLDRGAIEGTLRTIAGVASGSVVAFDYFTTEPLCTQSFYWRFARAAHPWQRDRPGAGMGWLRNCIREVS